MADRFDLLYATLAFESGLVDRAGFVEVLSSWEERPDTPLRDLLSEGGWVVGPDREHLGRLAMEETARRSLPGTTEGEIPGNGGGSGTRLGTGGGTKPEFLEGTEVGAVVPGKRDLGSTLTWRGDGQDATSGDARNQGEGRTGSPNVPYKDLRLHATGGIGQVWKGWDDQLQRLIAVKTLRPDKPAHGTIAERFLEEARITARLEHPGIAPIYELKEGQADAPSYYAMRFIEGHTLREVSRAYHDSRRREKAGDFELKGLLNAFVSACQTVAFAHSKGVLHRDIKGQNVILGEYGEVVVLDWGLAKLVGDFKVASNGEDGRKDEASFNDGQGATLPGHALGTPAYMPPEQARGEIHKLTPRSDVYSLGAMLYEILTGVPPFRGKSADEILGKVINQEPRKPRALVPGTPPALEAICLKAMRKDPAKRYGSAAELALEVRRFIADEPVEAYPERLPKRAARWARRHQTGVAVLMALLLTAGAGMGISRQLVAAERDNVRIALGDSRKSLNVAHLTIGNMLELLSDNRLGQTPNSDVVRIAIADEAVRQVKDLGGHRNEPEDVRLCAQIYRRAATVYQLTHFFPKADSLYRNASQSLGFFADRPLPKAREDRHLRAQILWDWANMLGYLGRVSEAEPLARKALDDETRLRETFPDDHRFIRWEGYARIALADLANEKGQKDEAGREAELAIKILSPLADSDDPWVHDSQQIIGAFVVRGEALAALGDSKGAANALTEAVRRAKLDLDWFSQTDQKYALAFALTRLGAITGDVPALDEAIGLLNALAEADPGIPLYRHARALAFEARGIARGTEGTGKSGETDLKMALALWEVLAAQHPDVPRYIAARDRAIGLLSRHDVKLEKSAGTR